MDFTLDIHNNELVLGELDNLAKGLPDKVRTIIGESLYTIEAAAKTNCPTNLGSLKQSIQTVVFSSDSELGGKVECAENIVPPIGAYVEFGTGSQVQVPEGLQDYAMEFYVNGLGHLPAQPFLFPAFFNEQDNLLERLKTVL